MSMNVSPSRTYAIHYVLSVSTPRAHTHAAVGLVFKAMASTAQLMVRATESNAMRTPRVSSLGLKYLVCACVKVAGWAMDDHAMISMSVILPRIAAMKMLTA